MVGPPESAGMSLGLTRRTEKLLLAARLEVRGRESKGERASCRAAAPACLACLPRRPPGAQVSSRHLSLTPSLTLSSPPLPQVGALTGLVCRAVRQLGAAGSGATGRLALKLTTGGVELDVSGSRRFSAVATGSCGVTVGLQVQLGWGQRECARCSRLSSCRPAGLRMGRRSLPPPLTLPTRSCAAPRVLPPVPQGIWLKLRYNRAGHLFEFPLLLSTNPADWPILLGAYLLPPLAYWAGTRLVVAPLRAGVDARRRVPAGCLPAAAGCRLPAAAAGCGLAHAARQLSPSCPSLSRCLPAAAAGRAASGGGRRR